MLPPGRNTLVTVSNVPSGRRRPYLATSFGQPVHLLPLFFARREYCRCRPLPVKLPAEYPLMYQRNGARRRTRGSAAPSLLTNRALPAARAAPVSRRAARVIRAWRDDRLSVPGICAYRVTMVSGVYVEVPKELADNLVTDGFGNAGARRGVDPLSALSAGANLVSIFVARHEIARFVAHLWERARGRAANREHNSMVVFEHRGQRVAISLDHEGFGDEGPPPEVVRGMTALLEAMTEFDTDR